MVPHRHPGRSVNTGPGPRRRPWYRAASVPVHRQSGGNPWLRLSRQLRTVQTVQTVSSRETLEEFLVFYMNGLTRLPRSILVLLFSFLVWKWPRSSSTSAVACFLLVLLLLTHLALCSRLSAGPPLGALLQNGEVCTADASAAEQFFLKNNDIISTDRTSPDLPGTSAWLPPGKRTCNLPVHRQPAENLPLPPPLRQDANLRPDQKPHL